MVNLQALDLVDLIGLKDAIDQQLSVRNQQMKEQFDQLLEQVRTMRKEIGLSQTEVVKRLFPVNPEHHASRARRKKELLDQVDLVEAELVEEDPGAVDKVA